MINLKQLIQETINDKKVKLSSKVYVAKDVNETDFEFYDVKEVRIGKNGEIILFGDFKWDFVMDVHN